MNEAKSVHREQIATSVNCCNGSKGVSVVDNVHNIEISELTTGQLSACAIPCTAGYQNLKPTILLHDKSYASVSVFASSDRDNMQTYTRHSFNIVLCVSM
jgi:hypothetical protein